MSFFYIAAMNISTKIVDYVSSDANFVATI